MKQAMLYSHVHHGRIDDDDEKRQAGSDKRRPEGDTNLFCGFRIDANLPA